MRFAEKAGDTLPIYGRERLSDPTFHNTGRSATEAKGALVIELMRPGSQRPVWRRVVEVRSSRGYLFQEVNDTTMRNNMLSSVATRISMLEFPYFIPLDQQHLPLPVSVE